ncbi:MAG: hypothetical protein J6M20_12785 [Clostridia bacterium]|nr:hypothetical protein [Clostridia bacterium]
MKKILALLLSLMLLLPAIALGEAASNPDAYAVEFDDFTITMNATDALQKGEKANGQVLFMLYPDYDETATMHSNINAVWTSEDVSALGEIDATTFGNLVLTQSAQGLAAQGVAVSNEALLIAERDEETGSMTLIMSYDADYTAAGLDLKATLYMVQLYVPMGGDAGSYIFTLTGSSMEEVDALLNKLDAIEFKE